MTWSICPAATRVTQAFGCTDYAGEWLAPWCPGGHYHAGIDLAADDIHGQPVYATRDGVVVQNEDPPHTIRLCPEIGGGTIVEPYLGASAVILEVTEPSRTVWIEHGHLDRPAVSVGHQVRAGDLLGYVGTHGASCGDHLHVEVRVDGPWQGVPLQAAAVLDPTPYLEAEMTIDPHDLAVSQVLTWYLTYHPARAWGPALDPAGFDHFVARAEMPGQISGALTEFLGYLDKGGPDWHVPSMPAVRAAISAALASLPAEAGDAAIIRAALEAALAALPPQPPLDLPPIPAPPPAHPPTA